MSKTAKRVLSGTCASLFGGLALLALAQAAQAQESPPEAVPEEKTLEVGYAGFEVPAAMPGIDYSLRGSRWKPGRTLELRIGEDSTYGHKSRAVHRLANLDSAKVFARGASLGSVTADGAGRFDMKVRLPVLDVGKGDHFSLYAVAEGWAVKFDMPLLVGPPTAKLEYDSVPQGMLLLVSTKGFVDSGEKHGPVRGVVDERSVHSLRRELGKPGNWCLDTSQLDPGRHKIRFEQYMEEREPLPPKDLSDLGSSALGEGREWVLLSNGRRILIARPGQGKLVWNEPRGSLFLRSQTLEFEVTKSEETPLPVVLDFDAVDCHTFESDSAQSSLLFPLVGDSVPSATLAQHKPAVTTKGVAADGVSLVLLRVLAAQAGSVTLGNDLGYGKLYPITGNPFKSGGANTLELHTTEILTLKRHAAFALYRPPSAYGHPADGPEGSKWSASLEAEFRPDANRNAQLRKQLELDLIRPPVVLVHGTYDNPTYCWNSRSDEDEAPTCMVKFLSDAGFRHLFCVDWEETNGLKDPSNFFHNEMTVYQNTNGIRDAVKVLRGKGYAVTQCDLVTHSQGGVIARVYARGCGLNEERPLTHPHYRDGPACMATRRCWYHREDNYGMGCRVPPSVRTASHRQ